MTKHLIIIIAAAMSALTVGVAVCLLNNGSEAEPIEVLAYFKHPFESEELIELAIVCRVPSDLAERRIEAHREELRRLVQKAVLSPRDPTVVREARREILDVLDLKGKALSIEINVVPDPSAHPIDESIRKTLEGSHS